MARKNSRLVYDLCDRLVVNVILHIDGNILEARENIIAHSCNCKGAMRSGVAKTLRDAYPRIYTVYRGYWEHFKDNKDLLGDVILVPVINKHGERQIIANMYTQLDYGYDGKLYTSYDAMEEAFTYLNVVCRDNNQTLAMPYKIGCDRGGGDWATVYGIIDRIFIDTEVTLYKWKDKK